MDKEKQSFALNQLIAKRSKNLKPYTPIEPPSEIAKRLGLDQKAIIKLDANENPFGVPPILLSKIAEYTGHHHYPDPAQKKVRKEIGNYLGVEENQIVAGAGADEILDLICRLFLETGDIAGGFSPTFSYYSHLVHLNDAQWIPLEREENFQISDEKIDSLLNQNPKLIFLCSPNNPTGNLLPEAQLRKLLDSQKIVVLDEAYADFSETNYLHFIQKYPNLILVRTFSKLFAMAGLRLGYLVASSEIAELVMRIKPPYSVTTSSEVALIACLKNKELFHAQKEQIIANREFLFNELKKWDELECYSSKTNFLLVKIIRRKALKIKEELEKKGILVRYFNTERLKNYLRISVGTKEQNEHFLNSLYQIFLKE